MPGRLVRWLCVVAWMVVIFAFSHQAYSGKVTEKYLGGMNVPVRKMGHVTEFMILFLLVRWALAVPKLSREDRGIIGGTAINTAQRVATVSPTKVFLSPSVIAFVFAISYAATDEWHQSFVPGRSSNWTDVAVDASGVSVGAILLVIALRLRKNTANPFEDGNDEG
ncbi:VanZ family protein [Candidatus Obscuribacterales bacterium]|nr:VanZ family protein [Candidatus Obscuribacterales bacterium]